MSISAPPVSNFSWIAFSEHERQQVRSTLQAFSDRSTRDELGVGSIRDAFSDALFPGTSTIQTRARYFLFVPWACQRVEWKLAREVDAGTVPKRSNGSPATRARQLLRRWETRLIEELVVNEPTADGVIGRVALGGIDRLPSEVYWNGLGRLGIRRWSGSIGDYLRGTKRRASVVHRALRGELEIEVDRIPFSWDPELPPAPDGFPDGAMLRLPRREADYLCDRIRLSAGGTMFESLVAPPPGANLLPRDFRCATPWEHPVVSSLPLGVRSQIDHARRFSDVMHGGQLLYNLMLAEEIESDETTADYRDRLAAWADRIESKSEDLANWDRTEFWRLVTELLGKRLRPATRTFVRSWIDVSLRDPRGLAELPVARTLIHAREKALKGPRTRIGNRGRIEKQWSGASGADPLTYRWGTVQTLVADIREGLDGDADA